MPRSDAEIIADFELLAVELQLSQAVSIFTPKMPTATERPVAVGLFSGWTVTDTRPTLAIHSLTWDPDDAGHASPRRPEVPSDCED